MKSLFPHFSRYSEAEYAAAWNQGLFVFDTSALLNLYRYRKETRDELLSVLGHLSKRIWIPHHVALEFNRNRLKVIAEQARRFNEVKRMVEKGRASLLGELDKLQLGKRHALIDPKPLIEGLDKLVHDFLAKLEELQKNQQSVTGDDPLRDRVEELFDRKVGDAPGSQDDLSAIYRLAESRYKSRIPPGYADESKGLDEDDDYSDRGLVYKRRFGDFLIWRQTLAHAKTSKVRQLVFVTDDNKEDWWQRVEVEGERTIGPRPELRDEAQLIGEVDTFLLYNPEGFLQYAKQYLKAPISQEVLEEVRDVSTSQGQTDNRARQFSAQARAAVGKWLSERFRVVMGPRGFPDFVVRSDSATMGFALITARGAISALLSAKRALYRSRLEMEAGNLPEVHLVVVLQDVDAVDRFRDMVAKVPEAHKLPTTRVVIGTLEETDDPKDAREFVPYDDYALADLLTD